MENLELKNRNILVDKSFKFAVRIVKLYILSKQLLRSGTSIGANINEAQDTQSTNDFEVPLEGIFQNYLYL